MSDPTTLELATHIVGRVSRCAIGSTKYCIQGGEGSPRCSCAQAARQILSLARPPVADEGSVWLNW